MIPYIEFHIISLGIINIQVWGTLVALGFVVCLLILFKQCQSKKLDWDKVFSLTLQIAFFSFLFSRIFYVLWGGKWLWFLENPLRMLAVWDGGMASAGGFFGAALCLWIFYRKNKLIFWQIADILAFAFPFGWVVGRIGCFLIHDHPGTLTHSLLAVKFPDGARFDMALLEILALLPLLVIFIFSSKKQRSVGFYSTWLLIWYGVARFFLDFLRASDFVWADPRYSGLTIAQWGSVLLVFMGVGIYIRKVRIVV